MSGYSRLVGMSAAFATSNAARTAISFATSLVIARGIGVDGFGRWTLCMAWAAVLTMLFDLGFGVLLTREAARDSPSTGRDVIVGLLVRLGLFLPVGLGFAFAARWLSADPETVVGLTIAPAIAAAGIAYGSLAPVFRAWPRALVAVLAVETGGAVVQWAAAWWLIHAGGAVTELLTLAAVIQALQFLAALLLWPAIVRPRIRIEWPGPSAILPVLREAMPFAAAGLIANAQLRIAPVLLGFLGAPAAIASFGVAARIGGLARMLPQAAFAGALPVLSEEARHSTSDAVRSRFDRTLLAFSLLSALIIVLTASSIVSFTYGDGFSGAVLPLIWTGIGLIPTLMNSGRKVYLYASGCEHVVVRWSAIALAIQAAACAALIPSFGAAGAAAGLAIGEAAVSWPLYKTGVKPRELGGRPVGVMGDSPIVG